MKITLYTVTDCQYSKQEKDYLAANKLQYEEKNLETNKDFLTEMMAVSNNFAGTPVTRIEKDDGAIVVLKGFTKSEFDAAFGFAPEAAPATPASVETPVTETPVVEKPINESPTAAAPVVETPAVETPVVAPVESATSELNSVLGKLEEQAAPPATPPVETPPTASIPENQTPVTEVPPAPTDSSAPTIPDFSDGAKTTV